MLIKLCGFTEKKSLEIAIAHKCNFLGFVFYPKSSRFITTKNAAKISTLIPSNIAKVAVVVDADFKFLEEIINEFKPDFFQFHGSETPQFLENFSKKFPQIKIIKAFRIAEQKDLEQVKNFENFADYFLFDSKVENKFGGSGKKFNWEILQNFHSKKDWFLSGGINIDNIEEALKISGAKMADISSGIEKIPAQKSPELIIQLMNKIKNLRP
jgi:phosphoribosylanthranilate isomerase